MKKFNLTHLIDEVLMFILDFRVWTVISLLVGGIIGCFIAYYILKQM